MMVVIDSIIWIDSFRNRSTAGTATLESLPTTRRIAIGDLILILILAAPLTIVDDIPLLYADRDVDPFVAHLELRSAMG